jgi:hypothetical protein
MPDGTWVIVRSLCETGRLWATTPVSPTYWFRTLVEKLISINALPGSEALLSPITMK